MVSLTACLRDRSASRTLCGKAFHKAALLTITMITHTAQTASKFSEGATELKKQSVLGGAVAKKSSTY